MILNNKWLFILDSLLQVRVADIWKKEEGMKKATYPHFFTSPVSQSFLHISPLCLLHLPICPPYLSSLSPLSLQLSLHHFTFLLYLPFISSTSHISPPSISMYSSISQLQRKRYKKFIPAHPTHCQCPVQVWRRTGECFILCLRWSTNYYSNLISDDLTQLYSGSVVECR